MTKICTRINIIQICTNTKRVKSKGKRYGVREMNEKRPLFCYVIVTLCVSYNVNKHKLYE